MTDKVATATSTTFLNVPGTSPTFAQRVFAKVDTSGDCWTWTGATNKGYGVIGRGVRGTGLMQAHRAVYELLVGPMPEGAQYDHLCRNPRCVNPDHGEPVTQAVNIARGFGISTRHASRDLCDYGHPLDGVLGARGGRETCRYCKTCARARARARWEATR